MACALLLDRMLNLNVTATWTTQQGQIVALEDVFFETLWAIHRKGSLSLACKQLDVSYRTLWNQVQKFNELLDEPVIATQGRAGACLTPFGQKVLWMIEQGRVRVAPELALNVEQINAEWLDTEHNKPWISLAMSDDPVLQRLFNQSALYKELQLSMRWAGSIAALSALHRGEVKVAGCHLPLQSNSHTQVHQIMGRYLRGSNLAVVELFEREMGWISRPSSRPPTLQDVALRQAQLVNRNPASSTHHQLDSLIARACLSPEELPGYYHEENSHLAVACAIAAGHGDLGLGLKAAEDHYQLEFRPLNQEKYFLVTHKDDLNFPAMSILIPWLQSEPVVQAIASTVGYTPVNIGQVQTLETFLASIS